MLITLADLFTDFLIKLKEFLAYEITKQFSISRMLPDLCQNKAIYFTCEDMHIDSFILRKKLLVLEHEDPVLGTYC